MPTNFCPECGTRAVAGQKFCGECGARFSVNDERAPQASAARLGEDDRRSSVAYSAQRTGSDAPPPASSRNDGAENAVIARGDVSTDAPLKDSAVSRSAVRAGGAIEGSAVSRSEVRTETAGIRDAVISHSTITQTETHQHFGESVGTYEAQMDLGRTAFEGKNWQEAVDFFNTALKIDSRNFEPWFLKGMSCAELHRTDEAVTNLRRALKLSAEKAGKVVGDIKALGERIARAGQLQENAGNELISKARQELQSSAAFQAQAGAGKDKGLAGALALDMFVLPGLGSTMRTNQVVDGMEKRQAADKHESEGRRLEEQAKGHASEAVRLYNAAIRYCDLVLEFEKHDEPSWLWRGDLYFRLRLYDDACKSYESVLEFNPQSRDALRLRGQCFAAQGKRVTPPPGSAPPQEAPSGARPPARAGPPSIPAGQPQGGLHSPMIPQPIPSVTQAATLPQPSPATSAPAPPGPALQARPGAYQAPARALSASAPAAPPAEPPSRPARTNPCPYCRGEMAFVKEKGIWQCGSCRQYSAKPVR